MKGLLLKDWYQVKTNMWMMYLLSLIHISEGDTIRLELRPDEAMKAEKFPFDFVLTSTFRLDGKTLHHTLTVSNPGAEELRFGIGYQDRKSTRLNSSHITRSRMPSSA